MANDCADNILSDVKSCNFICGVVEGFYGRPWTTEQRKDLFQKMKRWGMDSYVYAPKDDYKHRAYWRELYTVEEAEHLTGLISAARAQGVAFYYALSPGLDITYSNQKEVATLKRKLEQVSQFGCTAFALLFDDIEPEMSEADKEIFQSFAHAQVSVTNEVQQHLGGSTVRFLLCPTQYCGTRAMPSVSSSEYLTTLGAKLSKDIDIMWTGPKVISKVLTAACIEEITQVLRRPPVIWDNLHANDYDQKRMFLGPYTGRSPELIPLLRGVLSNPNCEYNANTVPIRTLAHWANCSVDVSTNIDSVAADIKLEKEGGGVEDEGPVTVNKHVYHHRQALRNAVLEWLPEFAIEKSATGPIAKPQPVVNMAAVPILPILPMVNTCMSLTTPTTTTSQGQPAVPTLNTTHLQALADVCTTVSAAENYNPASNPIMNSLVSPTKVVTNESIPNPIGSLVTSNISMPSEIPVSTIPVPIMGLNSFQDAENNAADSKNADKNTEAEMLELASNDHGSENCNVSNMPNITVMSNTQNQLCTVSDCLEVRVSHMEEKDKVPLTNSGDVNHEVGAKTVLVNDEDSTADIIVDDCDERLEHKEIQNGAMSVGESPCTMSPPHTAESDMECTPENETAVPICQKNIEKSRGIASNLGSPSNDIDVVMADGNENGPMQVEHIGGGEMMMENNDTNDSEPDDVLNLDDLMLLCDLFYLPFEHGSQGLKLLQEFNWLKCNAPVLLASTTKDIKNGGVNKSESQEWHLRARHFASLCGRVSRLSRRLGRCSNQELAHDLCGYVWDLRAVVGLLNAYVKWLALGKFPPNIANFTQGSYTWFSKGWKEAFMSGDQEPWVFRGGLTADLQRLLPIDNGNDLLAYKLPASSTSQLYAIRPYTEEDREQVCSICHKTCRDGMDCTDQFPPELQTLPADRLVGPFLALYPETCMVVEEEEEELQPGAGSARLMGYACAAPDSKVFCRRQEREWVPTMMEKYPHSVLQEWSEHFQDSKFSVPDVVYRHHPAILTVRVLPHCSDPSAPKRLVTCLLAALRANGSFGVHVCINSTDNYMHQFYAKLGFIELTHDTPNNKIYLGRNF